MNHQQYLQCKLPFLIFLPVSPSFSGAGADPRQANEPCVAVGLPKGSRGALRQRRLRCGGGNNAGMGERVQHFVLGVCQLEM